MDILTEAQFEAFLAETRYADWGNFLALIPEIEKINSFGEWKSGEINPDGKVEFPYFEEAELLNEFRHRAYNTKGVIINFSWKNWQEGMELLKNADFDFASLDILSLCKLITLALRPDRFKEGILAKTFENGVMLKVLKALKMKLKHFL